MHLIWIKSVTESRRFPIFAHCLSCKYSVHGALPAVHEAEYRELLGEADGRLSELEVERGPGVEGVAHALQSTQPLEEALLKANAPRVGEVVPATPPLLREDLSAHFGDVLLQYSVQLSVRKPLARLVVCTVLEDGVQQ